MNSYTFRLALGTTASAMAPYPQWQSGPRRSVAALTHGPVVRHLLRPLKRSANPLPLAPVRACQHSGVWALPSTDVSLRWCGDWREAAVWSLGGHGWSLGVGQRAHGAPVGGRLGGYCPRPRSLTVLISGKETYRRV
jgi:hypothetical protein